MIVNVESRTMKKERGQLFPSTQGRISLRYTAAPHSLNVCALAIKSSADGRWESTLDHTDTEIFLELRPYAHDLTFSTDETRIVNVALKRLLVCTV